MVYKSLRGETMLIKDKYGSQMGYIVTTKYAGKETTEIDIRDAELKRTVNILLTELEKVQQTNEDFENLKKVLKAVIKLPEHIIIKTEKECSK